MPIHNCKFTQEDMDRASAEWGANCGPASLAFACGLHIDAVRGVIPDFERKGYTSPTMMRAGLLAMGRDHTEQRIPKEHAARIRRLADVLKTPGSYLIRIQWEGPWTDPGMNPRWAYTYTHWIAATVDLIRSTREAVFDCNGGLRSVASWESDVAPVLSASYKRATGKWFVTHCWRLCSSQTPEARKP